MKDDALGHVVEMLGEPTWRYRDPAAWQELENELGVSLPMDFKEITDAYAPVMINNHLYLSHPATERWNLAERIRRTSHSWSQIEWDEGEPEGDPRVSLNNSDLLFGSPDGLIPICSTDRGESIFYAPQGALGQGSLFIENGEGEFFEYSVSFAKWLYLWLTGEEVTGPGGSAFYPGPVTLQDLPMTQDERPEKRSGPPRGM
ncbi:SMI1/KNR4 family protein [Streptomyces sp. NBC_00385]|uniref:SMI1/KNR4 family protein n=1 Tax=Streptomyces sp. NBC_00385 TaxID=2975733 RepID=UPI002DDB64E3|nr:SMI1/KNR4 family protein [Streptomyces sp. NBC_00385]WRZ02652.1 SMI1/KNR4 family protein [Streptomyces sp. NBC_00385]